MSSIMGYRADGADSLRCGGVWAVAGIMLVFALSFLGVACEGAKATDGSGSDSAASGATGASAIVPTNGLPLLLDLGSVGCIPCDMMAEELDALTEEYADVLEVRFVDVNRTQEGARLATQLRVRLIPTQVFFDAEGNELARHEGYMSKEDIVKAFKDLGCPLTGPTTTTGAETPATEDGR